MTDELQALVNAISFLMVGTGMVLLLFNLLHRHNGMPPRLGSPIALIVLGITCPLALSSVPGVLEEKAKQTADLLASTSPTASPSSPPASPTSAPPPPTVTAPPVEQTPVNWGQVGTVALMAGVLLGACLVIALLGYLVKSRWETTAPAREAKKQTLQEEVERKRALSEAWALLLRKGDQLSSTWTQKSTDVEYILKYPLVADYNDSQLQEVVGLVQQVEALRSSLPPAGTTDAATSTYSQAVTKLGTQLSLFLSRAEQVRTLQKLPEERKRLEQALKMLTLLRDQSASVGERRQAYEHVKAIMEELGLMVTPQLQERLELEAKPLLALEA